MGLGSAKVSWMIFLVVTVMTIYAAAKPVEDGKFTRLPNVNEQSILASGPFIDKVTQEGLSQITPQYLLATHNNNSMFVTQVSFLPHTSLSLK